MVRSLRRWSIALAVVAVVQTASAVDVALPNRTGSVKFAVLGDFGSADQFEYQVASQMTAFRGRFHLGAADRAYVERKGMRAVLEHAHEIIARRLAPAHPAKDGKQTPFRGHPVFVAQHATATCCRACLAKWHGIEKGRELKREETDHVLSVLRGVAELRSTRWHSGCC